MSSFKNYLRYIFLISGFMAVGVIGIATSPASAACVDGFNTKNGKPCGGSGDGGQVPPSNIPIEVRWTSDTIDESPKRTCILESALSNGEHGNYICTAGLPLIKFDLSGLVNSPVPLAGDASLCDELNDGIELEPDNKYVVAWNGNATEGTSEIGIINWFSSGQIPGVGAVWLRGFADTDTDDVPSGDPNPLADVQSLNVDELQIDFFAAKGKKTLASCLYLPLPGEVVFESTPAP